MNSKNIKKSLTAKVNHWVKHIDNPLIVDIIKRNLIITGGAIVSCLNNEEVNDYDVYFRTKESCFQIADYYCKIFNETHKSSARVELDSVTHRVTIMIKSKGIEEENGIDDPSEPIEVLKEDSTKIPIEKSKYRPVFLSSNAITLSDKIQIVLRFYGEPEEIHKNYDFVHCTCWYTYHDQKIALPAKALEAIINKELIYVGSKYPLCSIIRSRKFISRGWTINAGQYLKMALQLNTFDLLNVGILMDQTTGVDSAYFNQALDYIKEEQKSNPNFKPDNTYLFEIINKIF